MFDQQFGLACCCMKFVVEPLLPSVPMHSRGYSAVVVVSAICLPTLPLVNDVSLSVNQYEVVIS